MEFQLPQLPYSYDALEPHLDARTLEIHHSKHHATYVTKLNESLAGFKELASQPIETLLRNLNDLNQISEKAKTAIRNFGGGHYNHSFFWKTLVKSGTTKPSDELIEIINRDFGSFIKFQEDFTKAAVSLFGSGWVWLVCDAKAHLKIIPTSNQDNPISVGLSPVLVIDLWEHAYYLKFQNLRAEYIDAWWSVINWDQVAVNLRNWR